MFLFLFLTSGSLGIAVGPAKRFYTEALSNSSVYDRNFAPYDELGEKVNVHIFCYQIVLLYVVENSQNVGFTTEINTTWHDSRLKFNRTDYNAWSLIMPPNSLWIPRIDIYNARNNRDIKSDNQEDIVEVKWNGNVSQVSYAYVDSVCSVDVSEFPFDEQYCPIGFTSALASMSRMELFTHPDVIFKTDLPEWEILDVLAFKMEYLQQDRNYSLAEVIVHLKRRPNFYIQLLIIPTFIITTICISAMLLPIDVELGERINLGIAGLLSLTFMLSIMLSALPKSPTLPLMGKWVIAEIAICCIAMLYPMLSNIIERRVKRFELRKWFKWLSLFWFFAVNAANCLTTLFIFVFREKMPKLNVYKPI